MAAISADSESLVCAVCSWLAFHMSDFCWQWTFGLRCLPRASVPNVRSCTHSVHQKLRCIPWRTYFIRVLVACEAQYHYFAGRCAFTQWSCSPPSLHVVVALVCRILDLTIPQDLFLCIWSSPLWPQLFCLAMRCSLLQSSVPTSMISKKGRTDSQYGIVSSVGHRQAPICSKCCVLDKHVGVVVLCGICVCA